MMHPAAVIAICDSVSRRIAQGDCPTEPTQSVETLESALMELWRWHQVAQINGDPDDEPSAGGYPELHAAERLAAGEAVSIPTSENEAAMMVLLGMKWLQEHAPHRLRSALPTEAKP